MHITRRFHTSPENFKPLAIIILSGHRLRGNTKKRYKERSNKQHNIYNGIYVKLEDQSVLLNKDESYINYNQLPLYRTQIKQNNRLYRSNYFS